MDCRNWTVCVAIVALLLPARFAMSQEAAEAADEPVDAEPLPGEGQEAERLEDVLKDMHWIGFQQFSDMSRVFVRTTEPAKYTIDGSRPDMVTVVLHNTSIALKNNTNHLDTRYFDSPVYFVQPKMIEGPSPSVRIEIRLRRQVQYTETQNDTVLALDFPRQ